MKIITISREFGSGGREIGKRLADQLGVDYYDKEIITAIAGKKGLDENYVFVCADMESKIRRCMERAAKDENLSRKEMERKIRSIDKNRAEVREIITHKGWRVHTSYHLTVNATDWNLKKLTSAVAAFAESWFRRTNP
ncbi:AAA family ATPase [Allofournierella sp.]|uniref:cytidylate kinase-like family protein n=1 Tax=Allofournierella sp. TaxID=1940256 RepID=UPI003AB3F57F